MFSVNKQSLFNITIIAVIFILSRLLFLFFTPYSYYCEEAKIGSIGHDIVFEKGLRLPFWGYLDSPHSGGSIFSGLAAVPFYLIFGNNYLALKMTALLFSLITLILWYKLLYAEVKNSQFFTLFFLIFFSFATPHYVQKSVILAGNTVELMLFNALTICYFWRVIRNINTSPAQYLFLGAICGFSFWIQFMSIYLFLSIILVVFISVEYKLTITRIFLLVLGFMGGATPLWMYNLQYKWATITADARAGFHLSFSLEKLKNFLLVDFPASFHFLDIGRINYAYFSYTLYALFVLMILFYLRKRLKTHRKDEGNAAVMEAFLILYIIVFIIFTILLSAPVRSNGAYGWNSMNVHAEYYIISLQPIMFALFILLNKYKNKFFLSINFTVSIIMIVGYVSLFQSPYYNTSLFFPMHSTSSNAYECGFNFVNNPELFLKFGQRVSNELQKEYMGGAADTWRQASRKTRENILKDAENLGLDCTNLYTNLRNDKSDYK